MAKILLMEDEADQSLLFAEALENMGHDVVCVESGVDALVLLKGSVFDLLITDLFVRQDGELIGDGGLSLISRVRNQRIDGEYAYMRRVPILVISGGMITPGQSNLFRVSAGMGANAALGKPVDLGHLQVVVDALLNGDPVPPELMQS